MNFGTKLRTILAIATSLNTALIATDVTGFNYPWLDAAYTWASIILNFIIVALVTYYNNDYTELACEQTGELRQKKAELKAGYEGELMFSQEEDEVFDEEKEENEQ